MVVKKGKPTGGMNHPTGRFKKTPTREGGREGSNCALATEKNECNKNSSGCLISLQKGANGVAQSGSYRQTNLPAGCKEDVMVKAPQQRRRGKETELSEKSGRVTIGRKCKSVGTEGTKKGQRIHPIRRSIKKTKEEEKKKGEKEKHWGGRTEYANLPGGLPRTEEKGRQLKQGSTERQKAAEPKRLGISTVRK